MTSKHKTERANKSGRRKSQIMGNQSPRRSKTRYITGASFTRLGRSTVQMNTSSNMIKPSPIIGVTTTNHWQTIWQPSFQKSTMKKMSEGQLEVEDTGSGWAFSRLTSSLSVPTYCRYSIKRYPQHHHHHHHHHGRYNHSDGGL